MLLFSDSMSDLAVNLASAKLNAALGRLSTIQTLTTEEVDEAIEQVITEMAWEKTMEALQGGASRIFQTQIIKGGGITTNIPKSISTRFAFDAVDDRAVLWAEAQAAALIREIDEETRTAIKKIVVDSLKGGYSGDDAAEMVSRIIGLNTRQTMAVENLYQNTIKSLTDDGVPARRASARAKKMAAEYRDRLIEYRGKMIARTEIMRAANNGRLLSWAQAVDDGLISSSMLKEWRTYPGFGARGPCPICLELRGTTVEIFSEFPNGSMMPPAHPFCRCTSVLVPPTRGTTRTAQVGGGYVFPVDPIGAVLSEEVDSTVEKANPYHDPKTGRFTHGPGGAKIIPLEATERNDALTGYQDPATGKSMAVITIERAEGTGGEAAEDWISLYTDPSGKGKTPDATENDISVDDLTEKEWYTGSKGEQAASARLMGLDVDQKVIGPAVMQRDDAIEFHTAIHKSNDPQPPLFRGIKERLVADLNGESQTPQVGDSMVLPLTSFSRSRGIAFGFNMEVVGDYHPKEIRNAPRIRHDSTIVRIRRGSKGYSIRYGEDSKYGSYEAEVVSAGRFRVTGTSVIKVSHPYFETPREMHIVDIEQTDVFNPTTGQLEPLTIAKSRFRDFGGSLAHLFIGRQVPENAEDFQKANPYHDRRTGRFTFAPANDMGMGGGGTPSGEREAFAARIRQARADLGDIDYSLASPEGIANADIEADTLQKQIEFGHLARQEIDRRLRERLNSTDVRSRAEALQEEVRRADQELADVNALSAEMGAERDRLRSVVKTADDRFRVARSESADFRRVEARRDELTQKSKVAADAFHDEKNRLMDEYQLAHPRDPRDDYYQYMLRRDEWVKTQPSYERAADEHTLWSTEKAKWQRYMDEVNHTGKTPAQLYGESGPGSRTPIKVSDDNPLKRDPILMEAIDARMSALRDMDAYYDDSWSKRYEAAREKQREAVRKRGSLVSEVRRGVVKEVLQDAGVEFSDGRVLLWSEVLDGAELSAAQMRDPSIRHWSDTGSIVTTSSKRSKAIRSVEEVAPFVPKRWAVGVNNGSIQTRSRGLTVEFDRNKRGQFGDYEIRTDGANTSLHELMHAVEASSDRVPRFEAAFFRYRTRGETPVRLKDLLPRSRYRAHEITKPDKFYAPYVGKIYGGGRYHELLTMTYADAMYPRGQFELEKMDPELQAWLWSTVILA